MAEVTTIVRVTITVPDLDPRDPADWAMNIQDHLWATFNDDGSLAGTTWIPEWYLETQWRE